MRKKVFIVVTEHFDLVWRRCFDRDFEFKGQNFISHADLEAYYIIDNISLCEKYDFYKYEIESVAVLRKFLEHNSQYIPKIKELIGKKKIYIPFCGDNIIDSNMVQGEGIVRNFIYGYEYLRQNYNLVPCGMERSDSFGNSAQIPQIARKFGIKWINNVVYSYCDKSFWRGLDGSIVLNYEPKRVGSTGGYYKYRPCPSCHGL